MVIDRQEPSLLSPRDNTARTDSRFLVLGNCQGNPLSRCLQLMLPTARIRRRILRAVAPAVLETELRAADVIISQPLPEDERGNLVRLAGRPIVLFPRLAFPALQPDITHVTQNGARVSSPVVDFHSEIVFFGWKNKMSLNVILSLFSEDTFESLNYPALIESSMKAAAAEAERVDIDVPRLMARWLRRESFVHLFHHPKLFAMADIARAVVQKLGLTPALASPENFIPDPFLAGPIWPVYPGVARYFGLEGSSHFRQKDSDDGTPGRVISLAEFVEESLEIYEKNAASKPRCAAVESGRFDDLLRARAGAKRAASFGKPAGPSPAETVSARLGGSLEVVENPYQSLPDHQFWRRALVRPSPAALDPVVSSRFRIGRIDAVSTAGSCFAQNIAHRLQRAGYNYLVTEEPPPSMSAEEARQLQFGVYSARYGNVYTTRQLRQLLERAFNPERSQLQPWRRSDGRFIDPYRPEVFSPGFASPEDVILARTEHLAAVRKLVSRSRFFVFTLGLTECWADSETGEVVPLAPGVVHATAGERTFDFVNLDMESTQEELLGALRLLKQKNGDLRVLLTVSPVPLIATYESEHVLCATTYSKAVLRVAAQKAKTAFPWCDYFPSYEIITSPSNRGAYYEEDLRAVTAEGVDHVMRVFMKHYFAEDTSRDDEVAQALEVVCEEELLDAD